MASAEEVTYDLVLIKRNRQDHHYFNTFELKRVSDHKHLGLIHTRHRKIVFK